jgi:peptide/nickel transport system substrate-binding protein
MVSPTAWQQRGSAFGTQPVGTGAFILKEWSRGSRVLLERNPNYWQKGLPYLDRIVVQDLGGSVIGELRLLTGETDYVDQLTPADVLPIEKRPGIVLKPITVGRWYFLQWHVNEPLFENAKLRQTFAHAIDRNRLNEITMRGQGMISDGPTPPADPDGLLYILFHSKGFANTMKYKNEQLDALLEQARKVYDMPRRKQLYAEAQRQIVADLPMVPLLFGAEYAALRASVNGFEWIPDQIPRFRDLWKSG